MAHNSSNILSCAAIYTTTRPDYVHIRLEEDITLAGFTPLFSNVPMEIYCHRDVDKEIAQVSNFSYSTGIDAVGVLSIEKISSEGGGLGIWL